MFTHLDIWAPNMFPATAEPLPPATFHPPPPGWPKDLFDPTPKPGVREGGGSHGKSSVSGTAGATAAAPPPCPPH